MTTKPLPDHNQSRAEKINPPVEESQLLQHHLNTLREVAWLVADEPDLTTLLHRLAAKIGEALPADQVVMGIVTSGQLEIKVVYADGRHDLIEKIVPLREGSWGWALVRHQTVRIDQIHRPEEATRQPLLADEYPCTAVLTVPILNHQNHPLGVVECRNRSGDRPFTTADQWLVETIVMQVTSGVERAQMFHHLLHWNLSLQSLFAFNAALNEHLDPPILVRRLVEHAAGFIGAEAGLAGLVDRQGGMLSEVYRHNGSWHELVIDWQAGETIPRHVFVRQCPYLTNEYQQDPLAYPLFADRFGIKNALCVPFLDANEAVLGFIEIHNKGGGREPFTWSDVSFVESLAHTLAVALRNSRLMQELDRHRQDLQALSAKHINLLEEERTKISRELHDEAGQALIGIKLNLQLLERQIPADLVELRQQARALRQQVNQSTSQLREIARALRTPALDELGLQAAVQQLVSQFSKQTRLEIHFQTFGMWRRLSAAAETVCYRIVQEALTNAIRHAHARQIWITITADDEQVLLSVRDDGRGFDPAQATAGLGLIGIRERASMLGGEFAILSQPGSGTEVTICFAADEMSEAAGEAAE